MLRLLLPPRPTVVVSSASVTCRRSAAVGRPTSMSSMSSATTSTTIPPPRVERRRQRRRPMYVAATRPDVGKTSVCLALASHYSRVMPNGIRDVGYMKAIGDRPVRSMTNDIVDDDENGGGGGDAVVVDGDVELMRRHFDMTHLDVRDMSPSSSILSQSQSTTGGGRGGGDDYAARYLDGDVNHGGLLERIHRSYGNIIDSIRRDKTMTKERTAMGNDNFQEMEGEDVIDDIDEGGTSPSKDDVAMIIEGTGHAGSNSIIGAENAKIASLLGADVILVANGGGSGNGVGEAFDELHVNRSLFAQHGVRIAGVVINKVDPDEYERTKKYLTMAIQRHWTSTYDGVDDTPPPILGIVPDRPYLGSPCLADVETMFGTSLLSGTDHRYRHYDVGSNVRGGRNIGMSMVTTDLAAFLRTMQRQPETGRTIFVSHVTRDDVILGFLGEYRRRARRGLSFGSALVICTGCDDGSRGLSTALGLGTEVSEMIVDGGPSGPPVLVASGISPAEVARRIRTMTPKFNPCDERRVSRAAEHYEPYIDFDLLLRRTSS